MPTEFADLLQKYNSTRRNLIKNGISHPDCYGNVVNEAIKSKKNPSLLISPLNKLLQKAIFTIQ